MPRFARVFPQLRPGIPTANVDCGVRATMSGLFWLTKGQFSSTVAKVREIASMGDGPTNYLEWDFAIDALAGKHVGGVGVKTNSLTEFGQHLKNGGAAMAAVDYGWYRRAMPAKAGSKTFDGYHAITFIEAFNKRGTNFTTSTDSLLDGRYKGCPNGPVNVPLHKVKTAMEKVGGIYAVLLYRDAAIAPVEKGELLEDYETSSLADILSDLYELQSESPSQALEDIITAYELQLGFAYDPGAGFERIESGIILPR